MTIRRAPQSHNFLQMKKIRFYNRKPSFGFTLVEIMIVVAIIVVLLAISVPGILRQRMTANEAAAVTSLKTICWAAITYRTSHSSFPTTLTDLNSSDPVYIDSVLASGTKQGYVFNLSGSTNYFNVTASPSIQNITGVRNFYADVSGVIRASDNGTADNSSTPLV